MLKKMYLKIFSQYIFIFPLFKYSAVFISHLNN